MEENIAQFCGVTGASTKDARKFLDKYKRLDIAVNAYYNDPQAVAATSRRQETAAASTSQLNALFDKYKDPDGPDIGADGTIKWCQDMGVDPEDVVLLAVAYELKSPRLGEWNKKGWVDGWKKLGADTISSMKDKLSSLRAKLGRDPSYFQKVYNYTFEFARGEGQRSLGLDIAQAFWNLLLRNGIDGGALSHSRSADGDDDQDMEESSDEGFKEEYIDWWFEFLNDKGGKGVSKDTWQMLFEFIRTIDSKFSNYDMEAAWPSTIDDFVEYAQKRLSSGG